ncbi:MAG: hypothetical protein IPN76_13760 [Saprospiraceae bacterium]|nr:hypothetical protein [Saprospiraceae bacterium]
MNSLLLRLRSTWNPDMYHGWGRTQGYFEGWYYKLVDAAEAQVFAVIPGISMGKDGESHAFIQVLDGKHCKASYHEFPAADFRPSEAGFYLQLGANSFSGSHIELDLPELKGRIEWQSPTPWPKMLGAPGVMGWYSFVPFMQCFHGVVSLHHRLSGQLQVHGQPVDFGGGIGYIEKDWGTSFPRSYIWMQSNHFSQPEKTCLFASVAHIPWLNGHFIGYLVGFQWGDTLYRFATYTGASMKASLGEQAVHLQFRDRRYRLEITALQAPGAVLISPLTGEMKGKVNESMQGTLHLRFYDRDALVFDSIGRNAGLELAGEVGELMTEEWRR